MHVCLSVCLSIQTQRGGEAAEKDWSSFLQGWVGGCRLRAVQVRNTQHFLTHALPKDWSYIVCAGMTTCPSCLAINTWNAPWPHSFRPLQHPNITTTTEPWIAPFNWYLSFFKVNILSVTGARPLSLEANKHTQSYSESSSVFILRLYYKTWCYYCIYLIACLVPLPWNLLNINPPI